MLLVLLLVLDRLHECLLHIEHLFLLLLLAVLHFFSHLLFFFFPKRGLRVLYRLFFQFFDLGFKLHPHLLYLKALVLF